jgi:hypothetical protein
LPILHLAKDGGMYFATDSLTQGDPKKLPSPHQAHASPSVPYSSSSSNSSRKNDTFVVTCLHGLGTTPAPCR